MARFIGYLIPILSRPRPGSLHRKRGLAAVSILALLLSSLAPFLALAAEPDSEAEGTAPPGLEEPDFEPSGEETALESLPGVIESSGGTEESAPIETEPAEEPQLPEAPEPPPPTATAEAPAPEVTEEAPPPASAPVEAPVYDTAPEAPTAPEYQAAPPPSPAPVENQPIVAPPHEFENQPIVAPPHEPEPRAEAGDEAPPDAAAPEAVLETPSPAAPSGEGEAPSAPAPIPVAAPPNPATAGPSQPFAGRSFYTVRPGDCLWWIAEALLPRGASTAEVEAEIARLWRGNAERIGTGDPDVILVGTVLALG